MTVLLLACPVQAAEPVTTPRTQVSLIADLATITPGRPFWAVLHIKLADGWHTYWKNPGDSGTSPILNWTLPSGFKAGDMEYLAPERLQTGPLMDYGYNNDAYYLVPIKPPELVNENATIILMLKAQWLVCHDVCVPEKGEFALTMPVTPAHTDPKPSEEAMRINEQVKRLPMAIAEPVLFTVENDRVRFNVKLPKTLEKTPKSVLFFPAVDGVISNSAEQDVQVAGDTLAFTIKKGENAAVDTWDGVVSLVEEDGRKDYAVTLKKGDVAASVTPAASPAAPEPKTGHSGPKLDALSLIPAIIFAFLGGLILNLMPCVLPILSLKILSVAKKAQSNAPLVRKQALAYTAGVVLSFMAMAVLLVTLQKVAGASFGWGFQMQSPVFVSFLTILMFVVGLNLSGVFELPVLFGTTGGKAIAKDNIFASFLTGVLAVLVATPCSAPFMAPAIGFALTQGTPTVLAVFAALGFGLAAPFFLLSIFPGLSLLLPKPGHWMLILRQVLAFPIYLTVVWLLWVLINEAGANGAAIAMLGMVIAGFCVFLFQRRSVFLRALAGCLAIGGIVMILQHVQPVMALPAEAGSELHMRFSAEKLGQLRKEGKAVFVDATADWCITCKVNESVALYKAEVKAAFEKQGIVTMVADWTHGDADITTYLQSFDRSGVPLYVYYPPKGEAKVLPQILTPAIVLEAIGAP